MLVDKKYTEHHVDIKQCIADIEEIDINDLLSEMTSAEFREIREDNRQAEAENKLSEPKLIRYFPEEYRGLAKLRLISAPPNLFWKMGFKLTEAEKQRLAKKVGRAAEKENQENEQRKLDALDSGDPEIIKKLWK